MLENAFDFYQITLGNQALLALLERTAHDGKATQNERDAAANLLSEILDDRFLFILHFHFDVHECVSGELKFVYFILI